MHSLGELKEVLLCLDCLITIKPSTRAKVIISFWWEAAVSVEWWYNGLMKGFIWKILAWLWRILRSHCNVEFSPNIIKSDYEKTKAEMFYRSPLMQFFWVFISFFAEFICFWSKSATSVSPGANITPGSGWPVSGLELFHWPAVCRGYNLAPLKTDFPLSPGKLSDTTYWNLMEFVENACWQRCRWT